jgi:hypothetical protein
MYCTSVVAVALHIAWELQLQHICMVPSIEQAALIFQQIRIIYQGLKLTYLGVVFGFLTNTPHNVGASVAAVDH